MAHYLKFWPSQIHPYICTMYHFETYRETLNVQTHNFLNYIENLSQEQREKTFTERWNLLYELEHIVAVEGNIIKLMLSFKGEPIDNDSIIGQEKLERILLKMRGRKVKSPIEYEPTGKFTTVAMAIDQLVKQRNQLLLFLESEKIKVDAITFPHPYLGPMTKLDWLHLIPLHCERHMLNMQENF